jgi:DNA-directed RNA polymerase subunit RPC12/RpoP
MAAKSFRCPRCQNEYDDQRLPMLFTRCPHCGSLILEQMFVRIVIPLRSVAWERTGRTRQCATIGVGNLTPKAE